MDDSHPSLNPKDGWGAYNFLQIIGAGLSWQDMRTGVALILNRLEAFGHIAAQASRGELIFPTSVNAALKLQLALANPDCRLDQAIMLVLAEPLLAARIVALANSIGFNPAGGATVTTVRAAVMRVGFQTLHTLAAAMVVRQFGSRIIDRTLRANAEQLWQHTAHVAALAHVIARRVTDVNPETALFAAIVHEVGGFYLLSRADEFPGLLDDDPDNWIEAGEELITRVVLKRLAIPAAVSNAIEALRDGLLTIPPCTLLDTLLLANQFSPVASPLDRHAGAPLEQSESALDLFIDNDLLTSILEESADEVRSMSAALLL